MSNTLKFGNGEWYGKEGTILAYNSENNNYKPLPFTFDRDSVATRVNKQGLIETVGADQPRIDYLNDSNGALLLEPTRSNLITYSQDLSNWTKLFGHTYPVTDNSTDVISPSGLNDASKVEFDNSSQGIALFPSLNGTYSGFVYVKGIAGETIRFNFGGQEQNYTLTGEWDKLERENLSLSVNAFNLNTFGGATARTIYVWGAQIEQGSYATSYIPTQGSAVTRLQDVCNQTTPDGVIGQTEGVLYCEVDVKSGYDTNNLMVTLSNGTNLKQIYINRSNGKLEFFVGTNLNEMLYVSPSVLSSGIHKLALAYKQDDFAVAIDGVIAHTDNSGNVPTCNKINVGSHYNENLPFNDRVNNVKLYNTRLSNSELQALTQV
jgi:hypothetical protein